MTRYLLCFILLSALSATAQNPIPRQGSSCPTGTYKSGDYCKPFKSSLGIIGANRGSGGSDRYIPEAAVDIDTQEDYSQLVLQD